MSTSTFSIGRRGLLKGGATAALAAPLAGLFARNAEAATELASSPYGPLYPTKDLNTGLELLKLPRGFSYKSFGWRGDMMTNGKPTPPGHDGMGVVTLGRGSRAKTILIRNHELQTAEPFGLINAPGVWDGNTYNSSGNNIAGGNTNIVFERGQYVETMPSLGGTIRNCAGGTTPWGSWLSCEETLNVNSNGKKHGYVFEVTADPTKTTGNAIVEMGRMSHEAAAVDPRTGYVYETEDASGRSGFYRFIPTDLSQKEGSLEQGGTLYMAKVVGTFQADLRFPAFGDSHQLEWVVIPDPDANPTSVGSGPYSQGFAAGGFRMNRGEGIWYSNVDGFVYVVDTSGGGGQGSVWCYDPMTETITCIFSSAAAVAANNPDNITVSPRGGILLCEDGGGVTDEFGFGERMLGLTGAGQAYVFCKNNVILDTADLIQAGKSTSLIAPGDYRDIEWCGATFDATGRFLFANTQTPGITFAITGPWQRGNL